MASLESLPNELLLSITQLLQQMGWKNQDLCHLSLTSRKMSMIAQDVLYKSLSKSSGSRDIGRTHLLVRTLLKAPELSRSVRKISLNIAEYSRDVEAAHGFQPLLDMSELTQNCLRYLDRITDSNFKQAELHATVYNWKRMITANIPISVAGILLTMFPNLEQLNIGSLGQKGDIAIHALFGIQRTAQTTAPFVPFRSVEHFSTVERLSSTFSGLQNVRSLTTKGANLSLLALPFKSLQCLKLDLTASGPGGRCSKNIIDATFAIRPQSELQSLVVHSSWTALSLMQPDTVNLTMLITALDCYRLRSFSLYLVSSPHGRILASPDAYVASFDQILDDTPLGTSLECLRITYPSTSWRGDWFDPISLNWFGSVSPGTLTKFTNLKKLEVVQRVLIRRGRHDQGSTPSIKSMIPASLEEILIYYPDHRILPWVEDLLRARNDFPHLRQLSFYCAAGWGKQASWFMHHEDPIYDRLEDAGIEVVVVNHRLTEPDEMADDGEPDIWTGTWSNEDWTSVIFGCVE